MYNIILLGLRASCGAISVCRSAGSIQSGRHHVSHDSNSKYEQSAFLGESRPMQLALGGLPTALAVVIIGREETVVIHVT